jgi:peptidyl-prolyl cis-trans isomerase C
MNTLSTSDNDCGSGACQCGWSSTSETSVTDVPRINGVALYASGDAVDEDTLRELACTELMRQEAVRQGLLEPVDTDVAPALTAAQREVIERMVDEVVVTPEATDEACERYYEAHKLRFVTGQALHVRHILFAVTPGVNVHALAQRAEAALLELLRKDAPANRFAELAKTLSNCPSGEQGGDLGWVGPDDCAPELANELFFQSDSGWGMGVHPRLVHTRYGFHIIEVLGRRKGKQASYAEVRDRIAGQMALSARVTALRQYMQLLAGQARVEGMVLEGAGTPLVQ